MTFDLEILVVLIGALLVWVRCCVALARAFFSRYAERHWYRVAGWWVIAFAVLLGGCLMLADFVGAGAAAAYAVTVCTVAFAGIGWVTRRLDDHEEAEVAVDIASARDRCARAARMYDLTRREEEVLALLLKGLSIAQIASELVVSTNTVKTHVRNLYRKLGVTRRQDLITRMSTEGQGSAPVLQPERFLEL